MSYDCKPAQTVREPDGLYMQRQPTMLGWPIARRVHLARRSWALGGHSHLPTVSPAIKVFPPGKHVPDPVAWLAPLGHASLRSRVSSPAMGQLRGNPIDLKKPYRADR